MRATAAELRAALECSTNFIATDLAVTVLARSMRAGVYRLAGNSPGDRIAVTAEVVARLCDDVADGLTDEGCAKLAAMISGVAADMREALAERIRPT